MIKQVYYQVTQFHFYLTMKLSKPIFMAKQYMMNVVAISNKKIYTKS